MENLHQINLRPTKFTNAPVTSVLFDDASDLVWVGDQQGRVSSYSGTNLSTYVSYKGADSSVNQLLNHTEGVLSLGSDSLKLTTRAGYPVFYKKFDHNNLRTMCYGGASLTNHLMIGGDSTSLAGNQLLEFDLGALKVSNTISHESKVAVLKAYKKQIIVGNANGVLDILDYTSRSVVKSFQAHHVSLSKLDIQNYTLVTTGYSKRHNYTTPIPVVDPLINVYDLRYLKPMAPLSFPAGASFICLHPKVPNMCFVCSASGQLQCIDLFNLSNFKIYQVNLVPTGANSFLNGSTTRIVKMEISSSGDFLVFMDNNNLMYLWSTYDSGHFNAKTHKPLQYPISPEYIENYQEKLYFDVDDISKPLNSVGMPYYKDPLLSNWPSDLKFKVGGLGKKIPAELLRNSAPPGSGYAKNFKVMEYRKHKYGNRNQHYNWFSLDSGYKKDSMPKFISEKDPSDSHGDEEHALVGKVFDYKPPANDKLKIPAAFSKLHILYSKFGIGDFDFDFYNKSHRKYSGLEVDIENSYCNSLLMLYRFVPEVYNWVTESLCKDPFIYKEYEKDMKDLKEVPKSEKFLSTELGYLFYMLSSSQGKNCRTTNFQNALCAIKEATALGLIEGRSAQAEEPAAESSGRITGPNASKTGAAAAAEAASLGTDDVDRLKEMIHSFSRFLLQRLSYDEKRLEFVQNVKSGTPKNFSSVTANSFDQICGVHMETEMKSISCGHFMKQDTLVYTLDIHSKTSNKDLFGNPIIGTSVQKHGYSHDAFSPSNSAGSGTGAMPISRFAKTSVSNDTYQQTILPYIESAMISRSKSPLKSWCAKCESYQLMDITKTARNLPNVMTLNLNLDNDREKIRNISLGQVNSGSKTHWLTTEFYAKLSNASQRPILRLNATDFSVKARTDEELMKKKKNVNEIIRYELVGFVCEVSGTNESDSSETKHLVTFVKQENQWYLFNDFLIIPIDEIEVLNLSYWWKKPLTVVYRSSKSTSEFRYEIDKSKLDCEVLYRDFFARGTREGKMIEYELLTREEAPKPGTLVALDAEFVIIESNKFEIRSNGTKVLVKPTKNSLARVSVVRSNGVPFIDDYIIIKDHVEDYITSFSGIESGDLDPDVSNRSLTYLEVAYRKLWLLLQLGVVFIGHDLANDFRAINIQVPDTQVRDTIKLYSRKDVKRKLGLKFLTYVVLGKKVQTGNHDSIEDARSALELYQKYEELVRNGRLESELDRVIKEGHRLGFKAPK